MRIVLRYVCLSLVALNFLPVAARAQEKAIPQNAPLAEFEARVKKYASLRNQLNKGAAKQQRTEHSEKIDAASEELAARIRTGRAGAKPGDIFTRSEERRVGKAGSRGGEE